MKTYLFAWNPQKWEWQDIDEDINELNETGRLVEKWSCASHRQIKYGDRAFLVKVGSEPRGIFASGFVTSTPFVSPHWDGSDRTVHDVLVEIDSMVNPYSQRILETDRLHPEERWTPQSSGISISKVAAEDLEQKWFEFLQENALTERRIASAVGESDGFFTEGTEKQVLQTRYERNPHARRKCIEVHGFCCSVCDFNFQRTFGELGRDFIHVHHLQMIANSNGEYAIDPVNDLRPVCPNCHAMIHRKNPPYSIEEMKAIIQQNA